MGNTQSVVNLTNFVNINTPIFACAFINILSLK